MLGSIWAFQPDIHLLLADGILQKAPELKFDHHAGKLMAAGNDVQIYIAAAPVVIGARSDEAHDRAWAKAALGQGLDLLCFVA